MTEKKLTFKEFASSNLTLSDLSRSEIVALLEDKQMTSAVYVAVQSELINRISAPNRANFMTGELNPLLLKEIDRL
jgi:hypothetical protein